jgi:formamidopyrimidine-DNA glycosylase
MRMPELPEVQTVVSELNRKLKNKKIKSVEVLTPKLISIGPKTVSNRRQTSSKNVKDFIKLLTGDTILSVSRRAKMLIFDFRGPLSMLVHLKMTGQFIYEDKALRQKTGGKYRILNKVTAPFVQFPTKHTHVIFTFTDGSILYFSDVRKFGYLKIVRDREINQVKELNEFGPEPLSKNFTFADFSSKAKTRKALSVKQFIMDAKVVTGIGNIYSDEILFHAKIRPDRRVARLSLKELKEIYKYIPIVLKQAIKYKGSSVGDFVRTDGKWGSMGKHHWVYGRYNKPCKVCGTELKRVTLGGRTSSFCSNCQQ